MQTNGGSSVIDKVQFNGNCPPANLLVFLFFTFRLQIIFDLYCIYIDNFTKQSKRKWDLVKENYKLNR